MKLLVHVSLCPLYLLKGTESAPLSCYSEYKGWIKTGLGVDLKWVKVGPKLNLTRFNPGLITGKRELV